MLAKVSCFAVWAKGIEQGGLGGLWPPEVTTGGFSPPFHATLESIDSTDLLL